MSAREWQPGDVARIKGGGMDANAIWTGRFWAWSDGRGPFDGVSHCHASIEHAAKIRPLVVIDPEDREQIERLVDIILRHGYTFDRTTSSDLAAAVREFANPTPPKPDEPTGLGAVVEDADSSLLTRISTSGGRDWVTIHGIPFEWSDIAAVRVLSSGVTA